MATPEEEGKKFGDKAKRSLSETARAAMGLDKDLTGLSKEARTAATAFEALGMRAVSGLKKTAKESVELRSFIRELYKEQPAVLAEVYGSAEAAMKKLRETERSMARMSEDTWKDNQKNRSESTAMALMEANKHETDAQAKSEALLIQGKHNHLLALHEQLQAVRNAGAETVEGKALQAAEEKRLQEEMSSYALASISSVERLKRNEIERTQKLRENGFEALKEEASLAGYAAAGASWVAGKIEGAGRRSLGMAPVAPEVPGKKKKMGAAGQIAAGGFNELLKTIGPLARELTPLATIGSLVAKSILLMAQGADQAKIRGAKSLQAFSQFAATNFTDVFSSVQEAGRMNQAVINEFGGAWEFASTTMKAGSNIITQQALPGAIESLKTFGGSARQGVKGTAEFAKALTDVSGEGILAGLTMDQSRSRAVQLTKAFNLNAKGMVSAFQQQRGAAMAAKMTFEDFGDALGDVVDLGTRFGDQRGLMATLGGLVAGSDLGDARHKMMQKGVMSMVNRGASDMVAMRVAGGASLESASRAMINARGNSGDVGTYVLENMRSILKDNPNIQAGLGEKAKGTQIFETSKFLEKFMGQNIGDAVFDPEMRKLIQRSLTTDFASGEGKDIAKEIAEKLRANDPAMRGFNIASDQLTTMEQVLGSIQEGVRLVGEILASDFLAGEGGARTAALGKLALGTMKNMIKPIGKKGGE